MALSIAKYHDLDASTFNRLITEDLPFVISGGQFGSCLQKWNVPYLVDKLSHLNVKVHVSSESVLNFLDKNFKYETCNFGSFMERCSDENDSQFWYLRSIGNDQRGREVADLKRHFTPIAEDIVFPEFGNFCDSTNCQEGQCEKRHVFSSVFRISSKSLVMWTHYDVMDNILLQVCGCKKVILFAPNDAQYLYLKNDKSTILDLDEENLSSKCPLLSKATRYECTLLPGDAIFIPALWFHSTKALNFSIGVNFFWKDNDLAQWYQKSDVYGNKDMIPATDAYANVDKALKHLSKLPEKYRQFYINMIINKLNQELF